MTRDEVIERMSVELDRMALAQAICHDGFDGFVGTMVNMPLEMTALDVVFAWTAYRDGWLDGWDARGAS